MHDDNRWSRRGGGRSFQHRVAANLKDPQNALPESGPALALASVDPALLCPAIAPVKVAAFRASFIEEEAVLVRLPWDQAFSNKSEKERKPILLQIRQIRERKKEERWPITLIIANVEHI
ncbi:hypothetical protein evm_014288 [Chilo suppressalis]|nr:hypothetical protein evm_014288 [Chilo suppressalis]